jgi:lanthanide-dependent methanol dehydrogenase
MGVAGMSKLSRVSVMLIILACPFQAIAQAPDVAAQNGFSPLDEVTTTNVDRLRVVSTFRAGTPGAYTSSPLPAGDELLVLTPFPHTLYALELDHAPNPGGSPSAAARWAYTPRSKSIAEGLTCCGAPTGGMAVAGSRVYLATLDDQVIALDRASGHVAWDVTVGHPESGEIVAAAPLPVGNELIVGISGDDAGARGALISLDAATGRQRWKMFSTGPDSEVGIGNGFRPVRELRDGADLGVATWPPSAWQQGGGGLAGPLIFDAASGLLFQATGHPAPWNPDQRDGENFWTSGLFAREAESGAARWFDPVNPHDLYGLGAAGGLLLATIADRSVLIHPDANGYLYVLDRASGAVLSASSYLPITATQGVDPKTGKLIRDPRHIPQRGATLRDICPAWPAGSNTQPAFSPQTGLVYLPVAQLCMDIEPVATSYIAGTLFTGANVRMRPVPGRTRGALIGWDPSARRPAWSVSEPLPLRGGALATAGGLVFYGTLDGLFKAADARSGKVLWQFRTASGIVGRPVTWRGMDGRQHVAVLAGLGGLTGTKSAREIDARDATAAHGLASALGALPPPAYAGGTLYVFGLP